MHVSAKYFLMDIIRLRFCNSREQLFVNACKLEGRLKCACQNVHSGHCKITFFNQREKFLIIILFYFRDK